MSLADVLKADLEDLDEQEEAEFYNEHVKQEPMEGVAEEEKMPQVTDSSQSVRQIAKLMESEKLQSIITRIEFYQSSAPRTMIVGPVEQDPEYKLIVDANNITVEVDTEISLIHKYIRDKYSKRFPELESLVLNPLDFIRTARELGNDVERAKNNERLQQFLSTPTIMIVSVSASTTQGSRLSEQELDLINEACDIVIKLNDIKLRIFEYVESRMTFIAPNLSIIVGASTAAKIMGIAGGLTNLSKMPACNILLLGQQKKNLSGFSTTQIIPHTGYIYYSDMVQKLPPDLRRNVARILACKCALAARVDSFHEVSSPKNYLSHDYHFNEFKSRDGRVGNQFSEEIKMRIDKLQEPPPVKQAKPLSAPIEQARKKRGGRRARKMKERLGLTELRRAHNRMTFGEIEEDAYQDDLSVSLGQMGGRSGSGRVRAAQVDAKTKARISQKLQKTLQKQNNSQWGGLSTVRGTKTSAVAGTASSVAFTSMQGLEIVNPNAAEKEKGSESQKYFSSASGFAKVSSVMPKYA